MSSCEILEFTFASVKLCYRTAQYSMDHYHGLNNSRGREPGEWKGGFCCGRV